MADFLTAIKSVRIQTDGDAAEAALTAVTSKQTRTRGDNADFEGIAPSHGQAILAASPEDALQILRSQPGLDQLLSILQQLQRQTFSSGSFTLHCPGPLQAQIINTLVVGILSNFSAVLSDSQLVGLTSCLQNVAGMNAVVARLRQLSLQEESKSSQSMQLLPDLIRLCSNLFSGDMVILNVHRGLKANLIDSTKRDMTWKEFVNLVSSGRVISTIAQAEDTIKVKPQCWLAEGNKYASWLGRNIAHLVETDSEPETTTVAAQVLNKAMNLGYPNSILSGLFRILLRSEDSLSKSLDGLQRLLHNLPAHVKRVLIEHVLRWLSTLVPQPNATDNTDNHVIASVAACLSLLAQDLQIKQNVVSFLTNPALSASVPLTILRASITVLAGDDETDELYNMLEALISTFNDRLFIDHASNSQQDSLVQTILLISGYLHRRNPVAYLVLGRSSNAIHGVSNRLDASNSHARWLGMVFGTAVSRLVDKEGSRMNFGSDELDTEETTLFLNLVEVQDPVGSISDFSRLLDASMTHEAPTQLVLPLRKSEKSRQARNKNTLDGKPVFGPPRPPAQTEIIGDRISEIVDDGVDDENGFKPYAKPDSDPEDSDEDATLVNRHKVRPPVYIRDLMSMLRDDQNHNRFQLGIKHAAPLIRRKANFGAEVKDHAEELASILCNLQDPFETEAFEELKISALIAVLLSDVKVIAPMLCQKAFSGDFSLAQRCIILSALGLGGRELAGFVNEDALNPALQQTGFPTKKLPPRLHSIYTSITPATTQKLDAASADTERKLIQPLALRAADQSTSHLDAVKVRTFSSRMDLERTKRKIAPNELAKIFAEGFFIPLTNRYQQEISAYGTASVYASVPFVLVTYLRTLALLVHASGPTTIGLPQVTAEFWDLLLSLRGQAISDLTILQAVLFSLLTLLEVNTDNKRQIAHDLPKQLMETQQWVDLVFERTGGGGLISEQKQDDEAKIRTLAAGVLVKIREIIDAYQQQLVGYTT